MTLKINFPNPWEFQGENVGQFFAQMRIAIKSAEKVYEGAIKGLTEEEKKGFWVSFNLDVLEATEEGRKKLEEIDPDHEERQMISLTIGTIS